MTTKIKLEKAFHHDHCDWEHEITATITNALNDQITIARRLISEHGFISSIDIDPGDFLDETTSDLLFEQCAFDVHYLSVYRHGYSFCIQGKYDSHFQAEYVPI